MKILSPVFVLITLLPAPIAYAMHDAPRDPVTQRWYSTVEAEKGRDIFAANCAPCHGNQAQGQPNWEERDSSGYYPAPPLDGTGHSANHPIGQMLRTLDTGGGPMGGTMPSFSDVLTADDKQAVVAWIQSLWPANTYEAWTLVHDN